ncbi:hypothetical protein F25303_13211 [Fusarium sp. NRRL 25303]|nr:hypothetical protein F25303_13211 [Fusarium sp. NRRL 25303]
MDVDDQEVGRPCKRIRLQSSEPDIVYDNFGDSLLSDSELFRQLTCDNGFTTSISEPTEEDKDEKGLDVGGEALVTETVRHVCLGTITPKTASSYFKNRQESEAMVNIRQCGSIIKLSTADTGAYAGLVTDFPPDLLQRPSVKVSAVLTAPTSLRVIILSHIEEAAEIGTLLSNNDLFLQHPSSRDIEYFDLEMEYFNPHYLVIPGSRMPQLEDLAIEYNESTSADSLTLDEQKKGQLIGIFDTAADLSIRPTTEPSPRLQTRLKDYQLKALTFMSEKECTNVESPQCPSLWVARDASNGKDRADVVPICAGGILADVRRPSHPHFAYHAELTKFNSQEMGLGKTLCVLSLICWSLDSLRNAEAQENGSESFTTLVVTPKSMIPGWQAQIERHMMPGQIRVACYHGTGRQNIVRQFRDNDIVLTTYQTLRSEWTNTGPLFREPWFRVVLDEGMKPLDAKGRFDHWITNPIRDNEQEGLRKLRILVETTCLRRTKSSISQALPPPTVREEKVDLHPYDRALYDFFESEAAKNATDSPNNYPAKHSNAAKPGMNCSIDSSCNTLPSAKVQRLIHNIRAEQVINSAGSSILPVKSVVFSYWTKMLNLVQAAILQAGFSCVRIDGQYSIRQREKALSKFAKDPSCTVMLATLGSGGEGIDLTSANHVHLLEPHWNPMAEEQAVARVHRLGQQRHVTATKYITPDSIEEYVQSIQIKKIRLVRDTWSVNDDSAGNGTDHETSRKVEQWLAQRSKM